MPADRQKTAAPAKPFTPALSSNFRTAKSPLTPKLAASAQSTPATSPRHGPPGSTQNESPIPQSRNVLGTPTASNLNGNITPRSSTRKSRAFDSPTTPSSFSPQPKATPRPISIGYASDKGSYRGHDTTGLGISHQPSINSPHFFHAADARSSLSASELEERPKLPQKKNTFFYASGVPEEPIVSGAASHTSSSIVSANDRSSYLETGKIVQQTASRSPPSAASSSRTPNSDVMRNGALRPPSPLKDMTVDRASSTVQNTASSGSGSSLSPSFTKSTAMDPRARQASLGRAGVASTPKTHRKSLSTASQKSIGGDELRAIQSPPLPSPSIISPQALTASPLMSPVESISVSEKRKSLPFATDHDQPPLSPSKVDASTHIQKANELAANARRERKVLDLEISNSSLLAINRTLEREMRKQSAELRRYRRLSRTGRLSLVAPSTRSVSGQSGLSTLPESEDEQLSEIEDLTESDENDFESSYDDSDGSEMSPNLQAEKDAQHRAKDEKRLQLDLSRHQQLLIDSQKMNQSIRRCVAWTDELITEGKKALDYQVRVSDIELGGRVLSVEDEAPETSKGLLSPSTAMTFFEEAQMWVDKLGAMVEDGRGDPVLEDTSPAELPLDS